MRRPESDWAKQADHLLRSAEQRVRDGSERWPMFVMFAGSEAFVIQAVGEPEVAKCLPAVLAVYCVAQDADALAFVGGGNATFMRNGDERQFEIVIAEIAFRDEAGERRYLSRSSEVVRGVNGKPQEFRPDPIPRLSTDDKVLGGLADIFPRKQPPAAEIASAGRALPQLLDMLGMAMQDINAPRTLH